jgi:phosphoglycolate phosphatase-like HAD superfamily hydrolase
MPSARTASCSTTWSVTTSAPPDRSTSTRHVAGSTVSGAPSPGPTNRDHRRAGRPLPELAEASGPHELLTSAGAVSPDLPKVIEEALQLAEIRAAESATPTPGAAEFLAACRDTGRPVAVVSNNCLPAVVAYLERVGLAGLVQHIEAREEVDPARMKPSPYLVERAAHAIGVPLASRSVIRPTDPRQVSKSADDGTGANARICGDPRAVMPKHECRATPTWCL